MKMPAKRYWLAAKLILVVGLTLLSGVLQGHIRNRWGVPQAMRVAGQLLQDVPATFPGASGPWRVETVGEIGQYAVDQLECVASLARTYRNQRSGELVTVALILGPAGPMSVHTPEICFSSREYQEADLRQRVTLHNVAAGDAAEQFWALDFRSRRAWGDPLRVYYAWSTGGGWLAPDDARFALAGWPYLYKLQIAANAPRGANLQRNDPCRNFLNDFLPVVRQYLVSPPRRGE